MDHFCFRYKNQVYLKQFLQMIIDLFPGKIYLYGDLLGRKGITIKTLNDGFAGRVGKFPQSINIINDIGFHLVLIVLSLITLFCQFFTARFFTGRNRFPCVKYIIAFSQVGVRRRFVQNFICFCFFLSLVHSFIELVYILLVRRNINLQ